jgi:hypothetical protein
MQDLTRHIGRIIRGEKNKTGRNFLRFSGTAEGSIGTESSDLFRWEG